MNLILAVQFELCLAALFVFGVCVGGLLNLGVYRLAYHARSISPWSRPLPDAAPRRWFDRVPVFGWLTLRREAKLHGTAYWLRPMFVELLCGVGFAALYWWEIKQQGLLLPRVPVPGPAVLHLQYVSHLLLLSLMLVASLIDVDERNIPDSITLPGTLLGLLLAVIFPWSLLPDLLRQVNLDMFGNPLGAPPAPPAYDFLHLTSPRPWPQWLDGFPGKWSLGVALGCWWLWCVALMERNWYSRFGFRRALKYFVAGLIRRPSTWGILLMGLAGSAGIVALWFPGGPRWAGLLTALVGMAAGGGVIWAIRILGATVLRREAMGFGDVTLMAMIGAFLGWQACVIVFFLAPFIGLIVGVSNWILRRDNEICYGPFLCLAAAVLIVRWADLWTWAGPLVPPGRLIPVIVLVCLVLMTVLLGISRMIRMALEQFQRRRREIAAGLRRKRR